MKTYIYNATKTGLLLLVIVIFSNSFVSATAYKAISSGNWSSSSTWWGGSVPSFTLGVKDKVDIGSGIAVIMDKTVIINGASAQLSLNGKLTSVSDSLILISGTLTGSGTLNINNVVLYATGNFSFLGLLIANTFTNSIPGLNSSALITVNNVLLLKGDIIIQPSGSLKMNGNSSIIMDGGSLYEKGGKLNLSLPYKVNYTSASVTAMELSGTGLQSITINIPDSSNVTMGSDLIVNVPLKLISGSLMLNGYTLTLNGEVSGKGTLGGDKGANLIINTPYGLYSPIAFTNGYQLLNNFTLNVGSAKSIALASALTVNGALALLDGSDLEINGVVLTLNGDFKGNGVLITDSKSVLIINSNTSILAALSLSGKSIGCFILNTGGEDTVKLGADMIVDTINLKTGTLDLNGHNLSIIGNIAVSGKGLISTTSASDISIITPSSIAGTLLFAYPGNEVNNFTVNIGSAGSVTLGSDLVITGTLYFVSGRINTGDNNLQITKAGSIMGANSNSYVITGKVGYLTEDLPVLATAGFPVGTDSCYSPASIILNAGSSTGTISVNVIQGVYSQGTSGELLSDNQPLVNVTWSFQTNVISGLNADIRLFWPASMEVNGFVHKGNYISHYESGNWDNTVDSLDSYAAGDGFGILRKGITSLSSFAIFDRKTVPEINNAEIKTGFEIYPNPVSKHIYIKNNAGSTGLLYSNVLTKTN